MAMLSPLSRTTLLVLCCASLVACSGDDDDDAPDAGGDGDGGDGDAPAGGPCDLSGNWAVQRVGFASVDSALVPGPQKASRWYYIEATQDGDEVSFGRGIWCGDYTSGDATTLLSDDTIRALRPVVDTAGRKGSYSGEPGECELTLERVYWSYGVQPQEDFLPGAASPPGRIDGDPALSDLPSMPTEETDAVFDADDDGEPGIQLLIVDTPIGSGVRHALQRGWEEMGGPTVGGDDFMVDVRYDFEQIALKADPEAFKSNAFVRDGAPHEARFVRVGDDFAGSDDDATCEAVIDLLPHQPMPIDSF